MVEIIIMLWGGGGIEPIYNVHLVFKFQNLSGNRANSIVLVPFQELPSCRPT